MLRKLVEWVAIVAALVATCSWMWTADFGEALGGMPLGVGTAAVLFVASTIILASCMALTRPGLTIAPLSNVLLGLILIAIPSVFGYSNVSAILTEWVTGAIVVLMGLAGAALSRAEQRRPVAASA
ncbi:hypothetical protein J4H86_10160 [Spiractinospora alimapuensis]|uniref:hypothetical protein n=1 Tax=Spiractinospora alimapuensis TaxID=2820884 RepID=UPI001F41DD08|nr:hypothetical protein [Spiractinospora alimapuensis]QVQ54025.1 hypothetical protein J4H86_10160 [Spiractinospora alimapuensis]